MSQVSKFETLRRVLQVREVLTAAITPPEPGAGPFQLTGAGEPLGMSTDAQCYHA